MRNIARELPVIAVAASEAGRLFHDRANVGDALFVLAVSAAIWVRRFGERATVAGTLASLPFVAVLISPVPPGEGAARTLRGALAALIAYACVGVSQFVASLASPIPTTGPGSC